jgi:hypothetical protein
VAGQPLTHLGMLVDGVIVEDHVNELSGLSHRTWKKIDAEN